MDKNKWKNNFEKIKEKLSFLKLEEDPDLENDGLRVEEKPLASGSASVKDLPEGDLKQKLAWNRKRVRTRRIVILALVILIVGGFALYNHFHVFEDYVIAQSQEIEVSAGTKYESAGKQLYRYNSDGVSCISRKSETEWSITYSMQAPVADVCGTTMVIAEQQGTQIYVVNEDGLVGNFETLLPILKVRVSRQGVVAAVLQEEDVTWVNLYQADGTTVASNKTTISESGYPLDIDISPDGERLMVSYLDVGEGVMKSKVVFYDFGSEGSAQDNYVTSSTQYDGVVIPEVYFTGNSRAVAVGDSGFYVFRGQNAPAQSAEVTFEGEIVTSFHDDSTIGFLFRNQDGEEEYVMQLYNYSGRRKASRKIDSEFEEAKIENGQILLYNDKELNVFSGSGRLKFSSAYEKEVVDFYYFKEFRKYLVITRDSFDKIRIS